MYTVIYKTPQPNSPVKATAHKDTTHNEKVPGKSKQVGSACLRLGIVDHVVMAHIYVQRANDTSRRSEKAIQLTVRARSVSLLASWDSQRTSIDRIREGLPFQSRFRGGCYVLGRVFQLKMGRIDLKGHA